MERDIYLDNSLVSFLQWFQAFSFSSPFHFVTFALFVLYISTMKDIFLLPILLMCFLCLFVVQVAIGALDWSRSAWRLVGFSIRIMMDVSLCFSDLCRR